MFGAKPKRIGRQDEQDYRMGAIFGRQCDAVVSMKSSGFSILTIRSILSKNPIPGCMLGATQANQTTGWTGLTGWMLFLAGSAMQSFPSIK
jgi:hypothetical protein